MASSPSTPAAVVRQLAEQLGEQEQYPRRLLARVVGVLGVERTEQLAAQARAVAATGGDVTRDGSRPRTIGGIFFRLVKDHTTADERQRVWLRAPGKKRAPKPPPPIMFAHAPVFDFEARRDLLDLFRANTIGKARPVEVKLKGAPEHIESRRGFVAFQLKENREPALPKGLPPVPPAADRTPITVYVGIKQWNGIRDALAPGGLALAGDDDFVIIGGYACHDLALDGMVVYTQSITTKSLEQRKRQEG